MRHLTSVLATSRDSDLDLSKGIFPSHFFLNWPKTKCIQPLTLLSSMGFTFHALSHDMVNFVTSVELLFLFSLKDTVVYNKNENISLK